MITLSFHKSFQKRHIDSPVFLVSRDGFFTSFEMVTLAIASRGSGVLYLGSRRVMPFTTSMPLITCRRWYNRRLVTELGKSDEEIGSLVAVAAPVFAIRHDTVLLSNFISFGSYTNSLSGPPEPVPVGSPGLRPLKPSRTRWNVYSVIESLLGEKDKTVDRVGALSG